MSTGFYRDELRVSCLMRRTMRAFSGLSRAPLIRDAPARGRVRHSDCAGVARARGRQHDHGVHTCAQSWSARRAQPCRQALMSQHAIGREQWRPSRSTAVRRDARNRCFSEVGRCKFGDPMSVVSRERSRPMRPFAANPVCNRCGRPVLRSAPIRTSGRSTSVRPPRMDVTDVTGLLHK
jgi:hypothetical protein